MYPPSHKTILRFQVIPSISHAKLPPSIILMKSVPSHQRTSQPIIKRYLAEMLKLMAFVLLSFVVFLFFFNWLGDSERHFHAALASFAIFFPSSWLTYEKYFKLPSAHQTTAFTILGTFGVIFIFGANKMLTQSFKWSHLLMMGLSLICCIVTISYLFYVGKPNMLKSPP